MYEQPIPVLGIRCNQLCSDDNAANLLLKSGKRRVFSLCTGASVSYRRLVGIFQLDNRFQSFRCNCWC